MLEKQIEAKVCDYAKSKGVLAYKFTSPARAAVPDRMFISPDGRVWFCEFKREGQKPTAAQYISKLPIRQLISVSIRPILPPISKLPIRQLICSI